MPRALQELFAEPLCDLGDGDPRLRGIFTPASERGLASSGVSAQFLENAAEYHARYNEMESFRILIERFLGSGTKGGERVILDIGSGSGRSVIPLLDLYPDAFVVATDISPELLLILRDFLESRPEYRGRYGLVCMDANNDRFRSGAFDLAVGAAILHHIIDPRRVLRACASALAPGGRALFFEPFETGHGVLRMAYRNVLAEAHRRKARDAGFEMLQRMLVDHEARLRDKSDPIFERLDDKWYFTREYFESATRGGEWQECRVMPMNGDASPIISHAKLELRLGMDLDESALPSWAWGTLREHEKAFSPDAWNDLIFEGAVLLRRSDRPLPRPPGERRLGWWWNPREPGRGFFVEPDPAAVRVLCLAYDSDGKPAWSVARTASLDTAIEPLHAGLPSGSGTGWWIADSPSPDCAIVVEDLGDRAMAAHLNRDGWSLLVGARQEGRSVAGDWLRFTDGAPPSSRALGRASLTWIDGDCLVALLPDGRKQLCRRLRGDEALPQNFRSMEN